jgi:zinc and cadmium transporter
MESSGLDAVGSTFLWIVVSGVAMSAIALVGTLTLVLRKATLEKLISPLVAFAAGALLGGAFFHMLPAALSGGLPVLPVFGWTAAGFTAFLFLEQGLNWHHCHRPAADHKRPLTYLVLAADALHNLIGGLSVGAVFVTDIRLGMTAWFAAAMHEIPQELGDFGVLVHGGWPKRSALIVNFASALTFPLGALVAYFASFRMEVDFLIPFAAGNFIYIGAVDLVPEVNSRCENRIQFAHTLAFVGGLVLLAGVALLFGPFEG